jgi:hypothetical protein
MMVKRSDDRANDLAVDAELVQLAVMPIADLRIRYREVFRTDPPEAFGPDLLRRSISQYIQENAFGGLSRSVQRLLDQLTRAYTAKPAGKIVLPRRIKPGSVLVRQWKGRSHRVMVLADGFAYDGKTFRNLSEIATLITGTNWNGPRFFGLRPKTTEATEPAVLQPPGSGKRNTGTGAPRSGHLGGGSDYRKRKTAAAAVPGSRMSRNGQ